MKVLMINSVCGIGSTGRICTNIAQEIEKNGDSVKIAYGRNSESIPEYLRKYAVRIGSDFDVKLHGIYSRITDKHGFGSKKVTRKFLKWADEYNPDILWLHNIHGYYINIEMLFNWIKSRPNMKIKWTLHDCWAFTGHCSHFTMVKCDKWRSHCSYCQQKNEYPKSIFEDNSYDNFERKKKAFTGVKDMTIITPSKWLADLVKESFLKEYPVEVHYNKIDKTIFKPTKSNLREKYEIKNKTILLGVASPWTKRKGLDDFIKLATMFDEKYAIILVGLSSEQIKNIPHKIEHISVMQKKDIKFDETLYFNSGIVVNQDVRCIYKAISGTDYIGRKIENKAKLILLERTLNVDELVKLYSMSDFFINPTYEDNYPTVNLEAKACGTKVVTYNTGGCVETLN